MTPKATIPEAAAIQKGLRRRSAGETGSPMWPSVQANEANVKVSQAAG